MSTSAPESIYSLPAVDITDDSEQRESRMISVGEGAWQ